MRVSVSVAMAGWLPVVALWLLVFLVSASSACNDVFVYKQRLYVDNTEFFVKGMCYSPLPMGVVNDTGLCSLRLTPFGEWHSACFDSDIADSMTFPTRVPPSPPGGWFTDLWKRDFPLMKAAGVNTLRLYTVNPVTYQASIKYNGTRSIVSAGAGKEHLRFLDMCQEYGFKVVYPLISDCEDYRGSDEQWQWLIRNQIDEVGYHPALLMYQIGNEVNLMCPDDWQDIVVGMGKAVAYAKQYQVERWHREIPLTTALQAVYSLWDFILDAMPVDIIGVNSYEGSKSSFRMPNLYSTIKSYSCQYKAPLFVAEFNPTNWDNPLNREYPTGFPNYWKDFVSQIDGDFGMVGAAFFEWNDENFKEVGVNMGAVSVHVNVSASGATSVDYNSWLVDTIKIKDITYNAICCGNVNGVPYNYQSSVWELAGRPPHTPATADNPCNDNNPRSLNFLACPVTTLSTTAASSTTIASSLTSESATGAATRTTTTTDNPSPTGKPGTTDNQGGSSDGNNGSGDADSTTTATSATTTPESRTTTTTGTSDEFTSDAASVSEGLLLIAGMALLPWVLEG